MVDIVAVGIFETLVRDLGHNCLLGHLVVLGHWLMLGYLVVGNLVVLARFPQYSSRFGSTACSVSQSVSQPLKFSAQDAGRKSPAGGMLHVYAEQPVQRVCDCVCIPHVITAQHVYCARVCTPSS